MHRAIQIWHNPTTTSNQNHVGVRYHLIRELIEREEISISRVTSDLQHADLLTNGNGEVFALHHDFVMNVQREESVLGSSCVLSRREREREIERVWWRRHFWFLCKHFLACSEILAKTRVTLILTCRSMTMNTRWGC